MSLSELSPISASSTSPSSSPSWSLLSSSSSSPSSLPRNSHKKKKKYYKHWEKMMECISFLQSMARRSYLVDKKQKSNLKNLMRLPKIGAKIKTEDAIKISRKVRQQRARCNATYNQLEKTEYQQIHRSKKNIIFKISFFYFILLLKQIAFF